MEIKRKVEYFAATNRRFVIKTETPEQQTVCVNCSEPMLAAEHAARILDTSQRNIFRIVESGSVHFTEAQNGSVLVCLDSLSSVIDGQRPMEIEIAMLPA